MQDATILNVASFANDNMINVPSNHAIVPNGGVFFDSNIAHELDPRCNKCIRMNCWLFLQGFLLKIELDHHSTVPKALAFRNDYCFTTFICEITILSLGM